MSITAQKAQLAAPFDHKEALQFLRKALEVGQGNSIVDLTVLSGSHMCAALFILGIVSDGCIFLIDGQNTRVLDWFLKAKTDGDAPFDGTIRVRLHDPNCALLSDFAHALLEYAESVVCYAEHSQAV